MTGIRARVRAEMLSEIKRLAREQIAADGAPNLSLRGIARSLGVASSAIYRYFPSRDELLTSLIIDSYDEVGAAVERADATCAPDDLHGRWVAIASALRAWALAHPSDWGLLFGTPVPGYAAPPDTIAPASRYTGVLAALLVELHQNGHRPAIDLPPTPAAAAQLALLRERLDASIPDGLLSAGLTAWSTLFGAIGLELFGHLTNVIDDLDEHYASLVSLLGELLGTSRSGPRRATKRR